MIWEVEISPSCRRPNTIRPFGEHRPEISRAAGPGILDAVAQCCYRGHDRLKNETKGHDPAWSVDQILPSSLSDLSREAVPQRASDDEHDHENNNELTKKKLTFRSLLRHHTDFRLRTTHRNPTWLVEVSIGSAWRAAGR